MARCCAACEPSPIVSPSSPPLLLGGWCSAMPLGSPIGIAVKVKHAAMQPPFKESVGPCHASSSLPDWSVLKVVGGGGKAPPESRGTAHPKLPQTSLDPGSKEDRSAVTNCTCNVINVVDVVEAVDEMSPNPHGFVLKHCRVTIDGLFCCIYSLFSVRVYNN